MAIEDNTKAVHFHMQSSGSAIDIGLEAANAKYRDVFNFTLMKYGAPCKTQDSAAIAAQAYYTCPIHAFIGLGKINRYWYNSNQ